MYQGIYEELISQLTRRRLDSLDRECFIYQKVPIDKEEAALFLSRHIAEAVKYAMSLIRGEDGLLRQIELANQIILLLKKELSVVILKSDRKELHLFPNYFGDKCTMLYFVLMKLIRRIQNRKILITFYRIIRSSFCLNGVLAMYECKGILFMEGQHFNYD
jgi:hypothetical protein